MIPAARLAWPRRWPGVVAGSLWVLASRRPRHPVGWLLLAQTIPLLATGAGAQYLAWGLLARPGMLPATRLMALYYPASAGGA